MFLGSLAGGSFKQSVLAEKGKPLVVVGAFNHDRFRALRILRLRVALPQAARGRPDEKASADAAVLLVTFRDWPSAPRQPQRVE